MDPARIEQLADRLRAAGHPPSRLRLLPGDVSPRRYLRVELEGGGSAVLAIYPPELRSACRRFLATGELLAGTGVRVPRVLEAWCEEGLMLLEDGGDRTLYDLRGSGWADLEPYVERAAALTRKIEALPPRHLADLNPPLGAELLRDELGLTWEVFLRPRGLTGSAAMAARLTGAFDDLCRRLGSAPQIPCHRDFMARNLMALAPPELIVLDHQDLRLGPPLYDLASLLNDSLFPPAELEERLVPAAPEKREGYHRAAAQRTLKAVGTFAAFARRGFPQHLSLIPPTLERALRHLAALPEASSLAGELDRVWGSSIRP